MGRKNKQKKTTWKERRENNKKVKKEDDGGEFVHFAYSCPPMETYYRVIVLLSNNRYPFLPH